jgi:hypothetical protein
VNEAFISSYGSYSVPISGQGLSRFFQETSQDNLQKVTYIEVILNEEQIRALATESRPDLEVLLKECKPFRDPDCHAAFVDASIVTGARSS